MFVIAPLIIELTKGATVPAAAVIAALPAPPSEVAIAKATVFSIDVGLFQT